MRGRRWLGSLIALGLVAAVWGCGTGSDSPPRASSSTNSVDDSLPLNTRASEGNTAENVLAVLSVIDGDTILVAAGGREHTLRLVGINAPENGECLWDEATARLEELLTGVTVEFESDVSDRDRYDRLLRYVYANGEMVNEVMVAEGYALARRYEPDTLHAALLEAAQNRAEAGGAGMWAREVCGPAAAAALNVGLIHYDAAGSDDENLNDEWVTVINTGLSAVPMSGWVLKDESASHRYSFPGAFVLNARESVIIYTGCGTDTDAALFWCNAGSVWNNGGDTVFLVDPSGNIAATRSYHD